LESGTGESANPLKVLTMNNLKLVATDFTARTSSKNSVVTGIRGAARERFKRAQLPTPKTEDSEYLKL